MSYLLALCALLSAATVAAASLAIGVRERFSRVSVIYMLEGIAIIGWQVPIAIAWLRADGHAQLAWIAAGTLSALFIAPLNLSFSALITGHWTRWRGVLGAIWGMTALLVVLHLDGQLFAGTNRYAWGAYPAYGSVGMAFIDAQVALMNDPGHAPDVALVTLRDVTGAILAQEQIERLAFFDPLTHLPNRRQLHERFREAIATADRARAHAAVLFLDLDLDRFKRINDTFGHDVGDLLLKAVAERISTCMRETDWAMRAVQADSVLARLGGDEFVLLLAPIDRPDGAARAAARVRDALARPFVLKRGGEVRTGASIGISVYPSDGADEATLMKKADLAM